MGITQHIRAVYEHGNLRLLDPVELAEGEQVNITILSERERIHAALGDLLVRFPDTDDESIDEVALARIIEEGFRGQPPLSETIIQERRGY